MQSCELELWTIKLTHVVERSCSDLKKSLVAETNLIVTIPDSLSHQHEKPLKHRHGERV